MKQEVYKSELEYITKALDKVINDLQAKLDKSISNREKAKKTMVVKGYEVSSEAELDELISCDVITSAEYTRYQEKLRKLQKEVKFDEEQEALKAAIDYFKRERSNAESELEVACWLMRNFLKDNR